MERTANTELRVGIFVMLALVIGGTLVFVIGNRRNMFTSKTAYRAVFDNVGGLRPGSPIRISGVDVGTVGSVEIARNGKIVVELGIGDDARPLVRRTSVATIGSKGLLGDKLVDISVGTGPVIRPGGTVRTARTTEMGDLMQQAGRIMPNIEETTANLARATAAFGDPQFARDIADSTHNFARVTEMAAEGEGPVKRLLTDRQLAGRLDRTLASLETASSELARTSRSVRAITDEIHQGDGTAHDLIYGQSGKQLVQNLANASGEIATLLREVRTGDGTAHQLIYEDRANELVENLTAITRDVRAITHDVRAGRGTIGGLLVDPSIYEDVKRLVGNLDRNEILRALVRYSIRHDERSPQAGSAPRRVVPQRQE